MDGGAALHRLSLGADASSYGSAQRVRPVKAMLHELEADAIEANRRRRSVTGAVLRHIEMEHAAWAEPYGGASSARRPPGAWAHGSLASARQPPSKLSIDELAALLRHALAPAAAPPPPAAARRRKAEGGGPPPPAWLQRRQQWQLAQAESIRGARQDVLRAPPPPPPPPPPAASPYGGAAHATPDTACKCTPWESPPLSCAPSQRHAPSEGSSAGGVSAAGGVATPHSGSEPEDARRPSAAARGAVAAGGGASGAAVAAVGIQSDLETVAYSATEAVAIARELEEAASAALAAAKGAAAKSAAARIAVAAEAGGGGGTPRLLCSEAVGSEAEGSEAEGAGSVPLAAEEPPEEPPQGIDQESPAGEAWREEVDDSFAEQIKLAIAQQQSDRLFSIRRWWYKPVAIVGNELFSIDGRQAVQFVLGKRMMCAMQAEPPRKSGYLVYDCAARALQECVYRPKGRLAAAPRGVLRVQVSQPCAPTDSRWPTDKGVWAFKVIIPHSIALELQNWMEEKSLCRRWLPASPPGLCRQCALARRVCVQTRNKIESGEPPKPSQGPGAGPLNRTRMLRRIRESASSVREDALREGKTIKLDAACLDYEYYT